MWQARIENDEQTGTGVENTLQRLLLSVGSPTTTRGAAAAPAAASSAGEASQGAGTEQRQLEAEAIAEQSRPISSSAEQRNAVIMPATFLLPLYPCSGPSLNPLLVTLACLQPDKRANERLAKPAVDSAIADFNPTIRPRGPHFGREQQQQHQPETDHT